MALNNLIIPNQLYLILASSDYLDIVELCKSNRQINQVCRTDPQIRTLILKKKKDYDHEVEQYNIKWDTDRFLAELGGWYDKYNLLETAIRKYASNKVIDELIRRGYKLTVMNIINAFREGHTPTGIHLLRDPAIFREVIRWIPEIDRRRLLKLAQDYGNPVLADFILQNPDVLN